ncbi:uncharacterized protein A4U43_C01F35270 [Asparagus officinalis]|uniref:Regulatory protein RecX n=1 Tax=Asparagus officinalis TaxID=4686 RepID=A0A5P1FWI7_ASPOF|nr:uncharacterized protein LOC109820247 isoform X1 [Asparagus officinalis]ONK82017.1 uncharacterized protein A4U43_C01F35270 [Asparagus officinalis]
MFLITKLKMAIFAANRGLQISLEIKSRSLLISSLAKKEYSTSGPVRYVPKSHTQIKNPQKAPALGSCEKKEGIFVKNRALESKRNASRLPKFHNFHAEHSSDIFEQVEEDPELNNANSFTLEFMDTDLGSNSEHALDEISNPHEVSMNEKGDLLSRSIRQDAEKVAIELLAVRAFTELELKKKLCGKKFPPKIVDSVITDIKCRGMLNDGLYAESFSRSRWLSSSWGPRRIKQALVQKGVNVTEAENAITQVFEGDDAEGQSQTVQHGMSKSSMDRLFLQASKQWLRGQNTSPENRKARIVRWLQYRGFNWGVTSFILKKLEADYPP